MTKANQITPGMTLSLNKKIYRVESSVKVTVAKGVPFIKTRLRDLADESIIEKSFKSDQEVNEVSFIEKSLEFLYPEGKEYLFLDVGTLDQILVPSQVLSEKVHYLKEGIPVKAMFYGDSIFGLELPQFLEIMVVKVDNPVPGETTKTSTLETGAKIEVPLFIESGDVVKVDTYTNEFIQRV